MTLPEKALQLRIYVGESDRWNHQPLYEAIVLKAREERLAGATVIKCPMGFGASSHVHTAKILQLSGDLPMIVEIIDAREKIETFLPLLKEMIGGGLVTLNDVSIFHYGPGKQASHSADLG